MLYLKVVGAEIAKLINALTKDNTTTTKNIHIIGYSLGLIYLYQVYDIQN